MLDTSVRVGVRVRPLSDSEINDGCLSCLSYPSDPCQIMIGKDKLFSFDFIFNENTSQQVLCEKVASPLVDTVLKGYNATLFAYGQTGSGKTYSMGTCAVHSISDSENGIVPRMVEDIFARIPFLPFEYTIRVSFLEIYKEDIHDLLGDDVSAPLPIREENQMIRIPGLTETVVTTCEEVLALLHSGSMKRSVGGTAMNQHSSRSHAVFTLHFLLRPKELLDGCVDASDARNHDADEVDQVSAGETLMAKLHLVDLAGSERQKKTHAEGDRLKEGININRGLLALGNVISALCEKDAKKRAHIPYRDSRLTRLLQDSLGGNSTTVMLACVSPADSNMEETLNTLRYADRARLIKNKPILNRADPKEAELARLRSLVVQLQAKLNKGGCLPPTSAIKSQTAITNFSNNLSSGFIQKVKMLEKEKRVLADELDRALEDNGELYKKLFDTEALRDALFTEVDKVESALSDVICNRSLLEEELNDRLVAVHDLVSGIKSLQGAGQEQVIVTKVEEAYEQCKNVHDSSNVNESLEAVKSETTEDLQQENGDQSEALFGASVRQTFDRRGSDLRARRLACKQRMESIGANLQQKRALLESLEQAANQGDECYAALLEKYEAQVCDLEARISSLEQEKAKLTNDHGRVNDASQEQRLKTMERELSDARRQLSDLSRLRKAKEARESECMRLRSEIQTLKVSMVRTAKQLKDESAVYRRWRMEKDREVRQLQEHERRLQSEISQMSSVHERQQAVLKRRVEAAAATERRLKEMLLLQRDRRNERQKNENVANLSNRDFAARVRSWVTADLDMQVGMGEARHHLGQLIESRRTLCEQLRTIEASLAVEAEAERREQRAAEVAQLVQSIESQTQQITDLQQKLLDAGDRIATDQTMSVGSSDQTISSRLAQLHNIQEARIAIRYLFKEAVSSKVNSLVAESRVADMEIQLESKEQECNGILQRASDYSMRLSQSEEQVEELRRNITQLEMEREKLMKEVDQLNQAIFKLKRSTKSHAQSYVIDSLGGVRRLSGTPVFSQKRRITRQSVQFDQKKRRNVSPRVLVPDSTKKPGSIWDEFDENDDPTDSSLLDPTWRLSTAREAVTPTRMKIPHRTGSNEQQDVDSRISHGSTRCKCRGACTSRCSCYRAGQPCLPDVCKCVSGTCRNRGTSSGSPSLQCGTMKLLEPIDEVMGPPRPVPQPAKTKRSRSHRNALIETQEVDAPVALNRTFDLGSDETHPSTASGEHLKVPSVDLMDISYKQLWPKNRLSYFPSPSLRLDAC
ncbi:Kinesin motor domain protein [Paragonimus heterotremus]|uniref:Kinesin motor domain protein n=1 Tax=Paragonimus heterotremus TaxID=100268 RepID=A0A8J4SQK1_9TREM|nr:Kinesin motor domain protein [Paragonimus heterotremus]